MSGIVGPNIVTDGLTFAVDAANPDSYVSGSTIWKDQTVNQNNGTLTNGPIFDSDNGGSIDFDGVDDYVDCGVSPTLATQTWSLSCWVKWDTLVGTNEAVLSTRKNSLGSAQGFDLYITDGGGTLRARTYKGSGIGAEVTTTSITTATWYNIIVTYSSSTLSLYINNSLIGTDAGNYTSSGNPLLIGKHGNSAAYHDGKISNTHIYNRLLSSTEILHNYNALKNRFI